MKNTYCRMEKNCFTVDEPIDITFYGNFGEDNGVDNLEIGVYLWKAEDVKEDESYELPKMQILSEKDNVIKSNDCYYKYIIKAKKESEYICEFTDVLTVAISSPGEYIFEVTYMSSSALSKKGKAKNFDLYFTVE